MAKAVWGIDVSKGSVKCVRLYKSRDGIQLIDLDVVHYSKPTGGENASIDDQIKEALALFKQRHRAGGQSVVCSMPGHSTFNRLIKLPPVDEAKCREIVQYEALSQIPFPIDEVLWDYQLIQRDYAANAEREVILFAIKKDIVEQFLDNIRDIRLNVEAVQFAPVALYNFLVRDQDLGNACVALDLGADNTDLIIIDGLKLWIRNLPITGNDFTKAIQKSFNLSFEDAEQLKVSAADSSANASKVFTAIQPVMKDLMGEVHRSIGYYKSISKQARFDKIVLMGNGSKTINLSKFVSQSLQIPAIEINQLNSIHLGPGLDQPLLQRYLPTLGGALGLALQGLDETPNKVNLLPAPYVKEQKLRKKKPVLAAIGLCLGLFLTSMYFKTKSDIRKLDDSLAKGNSALQTYEQNKKTFDEARAIGDLEYKQNFFQNITSDRDAILKFLNILDEILQDNDRPPAKEEWDMPIPANFEDIVKTGRVILETVSFKEEENAPQTIDKKTILNSSNRSLAINAEAWLRSLPDEFNELQFVRKKIFEPVATRYGIKDDGKDNMPMPDRGLYTYTSTDKPTRPIPFSKRTIKWRIPVAPNKS